jgi:hypothetical protein
LPIEIRAASIETMGTNQSPCSELWVPWGEHAVQGGASFLCQLPHVSPPEMQVLTVVRVWCWTGKGGHCEPIYCSCWAIYILILVSRTKALNWNKFAGITRGMLLTQVQEQGTDVHLTQCVAVPPVVKYLAIRQLLDELCPFTLWQLESLVGQEVWSNIKQKHNNSRNCRTLTIQNLLSWNLWSWDVWTVKQWTEAGGQGLYGHSRRGHDKETWDLSDSLLISLGSGTG